MDCLPSSARVSKRVGACVSGASNLQPCENVIREADLTRAVAPAVTDADELFVNLDGSTVETSNGKWRVEVCGIHTGNPRSWVQLFLHADQSYGLTVGVDRLCVSQVRSAVSNWLTSAALV